LKTTRRSAENSCKFEESQQETAFKNVAFHQGGKPSESSWSPNAAKARASRAWHQAACIPTNFQVTNRHAKDTLHRPKYRKMIGITRNARAASYPIFFGTYVRGHKISPRR
jgi:hypothetical protein